MPGDEEMKAVMTPEEFDERAELARKALEVRETPTRKDLQTLPSPPHSDVWVPSPEETVDSLRKIIADLQEENKTLRIISEKWGMCLITLHRFLGDRQRVAMMGVMAAAQAFNIVEAVLKSAEEEAAKLLKKKQEEEATGGKEA